jgi:HTH-type transcriptional regulator, sugar sensing transcriptional regulator
VTSIFDDSENVAGVRQFLQAGERARFVEELPLKLVIIDERVVLFGMDDPGAAGAEPTMLVVSRIPRLRKWHKVAFMQVRETGMDFDEAAAHAAAKAAA